MLNLIYSFFVAVRAGQGRKRAQSFLVVTGYRVCCDVSSPICLG